MGNTKQSIQPIGIDTEAYPSGKCFMICTSYSDTFRPEDFPKCLFNRKYRGQSFVCYNLKYDSGAFLQTLSKEALKELQSSGSCEHNGFIYKSIGNKCLTIKRGSHSIHMYDMLNFYDMSLKDAAALYLSDTKDDLDPKLFTNEYVKINWSIIEKYCIKDAELVERLAILLIKRFEAFGVYPKKLYSVAYISYQYFRQTCPYVVVKKYWNKHKEVLSYAMRAYQGGKFEVTTKGQGYFYEYDIVSAYPFEISNLVDISWARIVRQSSYRKQSLYGFLLCKIDIPYQVFSPCVMPRGIVNCYPIGEIERVITKTEYEYLISVGCDITIKDAYYIVCDNKQYPYRKEINRLVKLKQQFKAVGNELDYHTIKILLNSLYGKFVQLIPKEHLYEATSSWNPIYAAIITANCRIRMSRLQQSHNSVVAVHTDSILSTRQLPYLGTDKIGELVPTAQGTGIILGSGVYQIGNKVKFRGLEKNITIMELLKTVGKTLKIDYQHAYTWREIAHRGWSLDKINLFDIIPKKINVNFDQKRIWLKDWDNWQSVLKRNIESAPLVYNSILF